MTDYAAYHFNNNHQKATRPSARQRMLNNVKRIWRHYLSWSFSRRVISAGLIGLLSISSILLAGPFKLPWLNQPPETRASVQSSGPRTATASGDCTSVTGIGSVAWTTPGNAFNNDGTNMATAGLGRNVTSNWIKCMNFGFTTAMVPTGSTILGMVVTTKRKVSTSNATTLDAGMRMIKGGTIGTTDKSTSTVWTTSLVSEDHGSSTELWGDSWTVSDITGSTFGAAYAAAHGATTNSTFTFSVDVVQITVYFDAPPIPPVLTQRHYLFEQDDGANVNSNTDIGSADTALTNVKKGERIEARMQVDNTGTGGFDSGQFELYYDHNDGIWSKVQSGNPTDNSGSNCSTTQYSCTTIDSTGDVGRYGQVAIDHSGNPWVSYYDFTNFDLKVAQYVGSGGSGCAVSSWSCTTIDSTGNVGSYSSIAFSPSNTPWISYYDNTGNNLKVAQYVGSGGSGCAVTSWTCTSVITTGTIGLDSRIAVSSSGVVWVGFFDFTNTQMYIAQYVGTGGTGCAVTSWQCTVVDTGGSRTPSIAFDNNRNPWVIYVASSTLKIAQYVGTGGSGCTSTSWTCTSIVGMYNSAQLMGIASDPGGNMWISYPSSISTTSIARYVGSGGTGCTSSSWTCSTMDTGGINTSSIAFDAAGTAWITYIDATNKLARVAQYVGSSGSGCTSAAWSCTTINTYASNGSGVAFNPSIAFSPAVGTIISYYDPSSVDLILATLSRSSEIIPSYGLSGANGDALTTNAAGTCGGSTTFVNGTWQQGVNTSTASTIAVSKCSEVAFMIDTSQATTGTTYRLALRDQTDNRGLDAYSVYPTFTIVSSGSDTVRFSKDSEAAMSACSGTGWGCETMNAVSSAAGSWAQMTIGPNGRPWAAMYSNSATSLVVAEYVGASGSGCTTSTTWSCTTVDSSASVGKDTTIATGPDGTIWVAYRNNATADLKIAANSPKTGLSACTGSGWYCTTLDAATADIGYEPSIAFDKAGNPWVSYDDTTSTSIKVASYLGNTSGNCTSTAWNCITVDTIGTSGLDGDYTSLVFDSYGNAWVSYVDGTSSALRVATNSEAFGSACTGAGWTCAIVDNTGTVGEFSALTIDSNNKLWVAYGDTINNTTRIAEYVGSGGGCTSAAWNCYVLDGANTAGANTSITLGLDNVPRVSYYYTGNVIRYARYVGGSSGSGCTSTAWSCTTVDSSADAGLRMLNRAISVDRSGAPWLVYFDNTNTKYKAAKLLIPEVSSQARYKLDNQGYTYSTTDDTNFDQMAATTNTPIYRFDTVHASNSTNIAPTWIGKSSVAASTNNLKVQVYRYGTTNAWTDISTNSTCTANTDCTITPTAVSTNLSEYYEAEGSNYLLHFRVYQVAGTTKTLQTDCFSASTGCSAIVTPTLDQLMRGGSWFLNGVKQAFTF